MGEKKEKEYHSGAFPKKKVVCESQTLMSDMCL
jgi:hypothetical protein